MVLSGPWWGGVVLSGPRCGGVDLSDSRWSEVLSDLKDGPDAFLSALAWPLVLWSS